jgi:hypothetical protein
MILEDPKCIFTFSAGQESSCTRQGDSVWPFFPKDHPIYKGHLKHFNEEDLAKLRDKIADVLREPKYVKMAELADLE